MAQGNYVSGYIQVDNGSREKMLKLLDVWTAGEDVWQEVPAVPDVEAAFDFNIKRSRFVGLMKEIIRKEVFVTNAFWL